jgi:hypothetical protein
VRIGLGGKSPAQRERRAAIVALKLLDQRGVIVCIHQHSDILVVLGRGANHGRAADIDILDALGKIRAARDRRFERIKIDDQNIDRPDTMRPHRLGMLGIAADGQ